LNRFVLDCSVSAAWCLLDETSDAADGVLSRLADEEALVPALWLMEMANVLVVAERKGRITPADGARAVELLSMLPIRVEPAEPTDLNACRLLAREYGLSAHDASYLELAQRAGLPLATMDQALDAAAKRCGIPLLPA
jgi:predicted nucleic acid-binding protein